LKNDGNQTVLVPTDFYFLSIQSKSMGTKTVW